MRDRGRQLAEEHADYVFKIMRMMYVDAFVHGYKHGKADERGRNKR